VSGGHPASMWQQASLLCHCHLPRALHHLQQQIPVAYLVARSTQCREPGSCMVQPAAACCWVAPAVPSREYLVLWRNYQVLYNLKCNVTSQQPYCSVPEYRTGVWAAMF
jgi:hypothetical protein